MKKILLLAILFISVSRVAFAQSTPPCGFDIMHQKLLISDSNYNKNVNKLNDRWIATADMLSSAFLTFTSAGYVYEIPIVVHVLHTGGSLGTTYNPSDDTIASMITYLNKSYAATSPFRDTTASSTTGGGTRIPLKFVLAKRSPTGASTTGIIRINAVSALGTSKGTQYSTYGMNAATTTGLEVPEITALSRWPSADYYNVYCVNKIDGNDLTSTGGIAGFAYFPGSPNVDGMYVVASQIRSGTTTVSHEFGHAFGLYHTFQGDGTGSTCPTTSPCISTGDFVCDTEPHIRSSSSSGWCPATDANPCTGGASYNNVTHNIMDYTQCPPDRYTAGQRTRVLATLNNQRTGYKTSSGLLTPYGSITAASCTPTATNPSFSIGPVRVVFNDLDVWTGSASAEDTNYVDHSYNQQTYVKKGSSYTISVSTETNVQKVRVFIDYNNDGDFSDVGDTVFSHDGTSTTETHSGSITIPYTASSCNFLRMRVVSEFSGSSFTNWACGPYVYGQAEDYAVFIKSDTPAVTSPVTYAIGATASALTATGSNLKWYTAATGGTGSSTAPTPSTASLGTTIYYVSQSGDGSTQCESDRTPISVIITPASAPTPPTVVSPVNYCIGATASALTATLSSSTDTLYWYTVATGGTGTKVAPTPSTASVGSTKYYVSEKNTSGAESARDSITVVVHAIPSPPTFTSPVNACLGVTASALTATGTGLLWYTSATGGTGSSTAITPSTASLGTTKYYVSQTVSGCESARDSISVIVNALPSKPSVVSPIDYCQGYPASALYATGTGLLWYTAATGGTGSSAAPTPSTTTVATTNYYVTQTNATTGCESEREVVTINVKITPAAPTVTTPVHYCLGDTAIALSASGLSLKWYTVATGGTSSTTAPIPSTASVGTTNYYVTQTSATSGCESPRALIAVIVHGIPVAPTVSTPVTYCQNATAVALTATKTSTTDTLKWYTAATGGTGSLSAPIPSTASVGTTNYYVSQVSQYGCEGPRALIAVVVNALPTAPTVSTPVTYCVGATATALTATKTSVSDTLYWYTVATGGTGSLTAPTPSTASAGTTNYYVSQRNLNGCEGPRALIAVVVNALPTAPTVSTPVTYCVGAAATALTATKTSVSDTLYWYTVATGGTGSLIAPTPSTASAGTTNYYVSQKNIFGCEGPRALIAVVVNALPTAPTVSTPVNYCLGATATALTATKTSVSDTLYWYTVATGGTGSLTPPTPSTASVGTTNYYVSQKNVNGCEGPRALIAVVVNALPTAPTVSTPVNYCLGATATALTATKTSVSDTLYWYTVATGGSGSLTAPTPSTASVGTTNYYVSQRNGNGCEGPRAMIAVVISGLPAAPTVSTPVNYCLGATATALTATKTSVSDTLYWYTVATGGTGSLTAPTPSTASAGTTNYYVSQKNVNGCEGPRSLIAVVVSSLPSAPVVTSPVNYCQGATASPLTATGTGLLWYTAATGGTGSSTAPTPSTASVGTTNYYVSQTSGTCESPRALIAVVVTATPAAPIVSSPVSYCLGATASPLSATGTSLLWYTTATGGTGSSIAPTPSTASTGTTNYYVSQTSGGCEGPRALIAVVVNALPAAPTVSSPVTLCYGESASPLIATGSGLLWYTAATGGTGSSTAPTPSTSIVGLTLYYVSQTISGCESSRATIAVNVRAIPLAPTVTTPIQYCLGATASALTATAATASDTLKWYTSPTGGVGSTTAPTPSTATAGTTFYYVSQTTSGTSCEGVRATITVIVRPLPVAPTVSSPVNYCIGATATPLTATKTSTSDTLKWYTVATGGTASLSAPTPSTASIGTTNYYVSQVSQYGCEGPRALIAVVVSPLPTAPTVSTPVTYCVGATATALTATKTSVSDTLYWYTVATGGTSSLTAPTPSTASAGTTNYYVSQKNVNGCEGPRALIDVVVNALPTAPTVSTPVTYCVGATATALTATKTSVSDTLYWYTVATGGTSSLTAPTPSTASAGTTNYYVSQKNVNGCEGPRALIAVVVNALPTAPTVSSPVTYCVGATATALTATKTSVSDTLYWYTVATGGTSSLTAPTPSTASAGTTNYYVSQKNVNGCEGPRALIAVVVNALPTAPTVSTPVTYCVGATATALTATKTSVSDTLYWYTVATGGTSSLTAPTPSTASAGTTNYYVSQKNINGCEGPRALIAVVVNALPTAPTVSTPVTYCVGATATALTATKTSVSDTLYWYTVATGGTGSLSAPTPSTASAGTTNYYVSQKNVNGCEGPRALIAVVVNALPTAPTVSSPVTYCVGATATALTATKTSVSDTLYWYTVATGGTSSLTAPTPSTASAGTTNYYVSQKNINGCEGPRALIAVVVNALPTAPTVSTPITYCVGATATALTATKTSVSDTLYWYTVATGGTGTKTAPTPSTASAGTTNYYVSQKNVNGCEGPRALIAVVVNALPTAPTVSTPVTYCVGATATALNATKTSVSDTLYWYTVATGGTGSLTAPTPSTASAGTTNYYVSQKNINGCEGPRALIAVVVNALPTAPTVSTPVSYCVGATATALTATKTSVSDTLYWYTVATGGTSSLTAPTPSTASAGTTNYYVSQKNVNGCEGPRALIAVVVNALPTAPTVSTPVTYCVGATATALTATKTSVSDTLYWYTVATGGTGSLSAPTPSTASAGTTNYYVSQKNVNGCEGPRALIAVVVNALPTAPTVSTPVNYCLGAIPSVLTATGSGLLWYTVATGGIGSTIAPTPSTALAGTTNYYVSQTNATTGCESPRALISVVVNPLPTISGTFGICFGTSTTLTGSGTPHATTPWTSSATGVATISSTGVVTAVTSGTTTITYRDINGCTATTTLTVNPLPIVVVSSTETSGLFPNDNIICDGAGAVLNASGGTSYQWWFGSSMFSTSPSVSVGFSGVASFVFKAKVTNAFGCVDSANLTITTTAKPTAITGTLSACIGGSSTLASTGTPHPTTPWISSTPGIATVSSTGVVTAIAAGTTTITFTNSNNCSVSATFTVNPDPTISGTLNTCLGATTTLTGSGTPHPTTPWTSSAPAVATVSSTGVVTGITAGTTTITYMNNNGCIKTATFTVNPLPTISHTTAETSGLAANDAIVCHGAFAALTASGGGTYEWWYAGSVYTTSPTISGGFAGPGTVVFKLVVTSTSGCVDSTFPSVLVHAPLSITGTLSSCIGGSSTLTGSGPDHTTTPWTSSAPTVATISSAGVVTAIAAGTTTITYQNSNNCTITATYTVNPDPTISGTLSACVSATSTLTGSGTPHPTTPWTSSATGVATISSTGVVTGVSAGITTITYTNNNGCIKTATFTVNPLPASISGTMSACVGATSTLIGSGTAHPATPWTSSLPGVATVSATGVVTGIAAGTTSITFMNNNGCTISSTFTVNPLPAAPIVTSPVNYCLDATASALTATGIGLKWYTVATGGTFSTTAPTPSTAATGSTNYYVSQTNGFTCEGPRALITVVVNPLPSAPIATSPVTYCQGATATPLTATGSGLLWYTVASGGTGSTTAPTPSTAITGTTNYYVSQTNPTTGCEGLRTLIAVVVNPLPVAPTVTTPVTYCLGATASILTATGTGLKWYTVPVGGTASTIAPTPSTAIAGTTNYYVTQTIASTGCEGPRALIAVVVNPLPSAPTVTTPVNYCLGATASALTATGISLKWYTVPTGGTASTTAPTPSTAISGTTNYYVTQTSATTSCESPRAIIAVVVNPLPSAPTVTSPVNYCQGATASALTATGTGLLWYTVATGGIGSATAPTPSTATVGTTNYYVSQTNATTGCEGTRALIAVVVNPLPVAPIVSTPVTYCEGATASVLTASGTSLKWYTVVTGGTGSTTAPTPSTATAGTTNYYVSQTNPTTGCEGSRSLIAVIVNPLPLSPTVTTPVTYCQNASASVLLATGSSLKWYTVATGGTGSTTAPTPITTTAGTTNYYVSQTNATTGCESPRALIAVVINPLPAAPTIATPVNYCQGATATALTATGIGLKWYTVATGGTGSTTAPTPSTAIVGTTNYYVSQTTVLGCEGPRALIVVSINPIPVAPTVTTPINLCLGGASAALTATGSNLKWYTVATGGTSSTSAPIPSTASLGTTNYYVSQTSVFGCEGPRTMISVTVNSLPTVSISSLSPYGFFYCKGLKVTLKANSATAKLYNWDFGSTLIPGATLDTLSVGVTGTWGVTVRDTFGCAAKASVFVSEAPTSEKTVLTPPSAKICEEGSVLLTCSPGFVSFTYNWHKDGLPILPATPTSNLKNVTLAGTYIVYVMNNYGCFDTTNVSVVTYHPKPVKPVITNSAPLLQIPSVYNYYQWYRNGKVVVGANTHQLLTTTGGIYHVEVTDANGCLNNSDTVTLLDPNGIQNVVTQDLLRIYPNPTNSIVHIDAPVSIDVEVADVTGRQVYRGKDVKSVNMENLADGTYIFRIFDESHQLITVQKINKISN